MTEKRMFQKQFLSLPICCGFCSWRQGDKYIMLNIKDIIADIKQGKKKVKTRLILYTVQFHKEGRQR